MNESEDVDSVSIDSSFKILYLGKEERITCEIDVYLSTLVLIELILTSYTTYHFINTLRTSMKAT